jgi:hypothetical protein
MAVLAHQDWHLPREQTMDAPPSNPAAPATGTIPRSRSSPAPDASASPPTLPNGTAPAFAHPRSQTLPGGSSPAQQQPPPPSGWTPSPTAQPFYPQFYQNHGQPPPPFPMHAMPPPHMPGQMPPGAYYDPNAANAQFAQWAYHQMMFSAQQQAAQMQPYGGHPPQMVRPVHCYSRRWYSLRVLSLN